MPLRSLGIETRSDSLVVFGIEWRFDIIILAAAMLVLGMVCTHRITLKLESTNKLTLDTLQREAQAMEQAIGNETIIVERMSDLERREMEVKAQAKVNNDRIKELLDDEAQLRKRRQKKE